MKTQEDNYFGYENASHYRDTFSFVKHEIQTQRTVEHVFVVPWQLNVQMKKENLAENVFG